MLTAPSHDRLWLTIYPFARVLDYMQRYLVYSPVGLRAWRTGYHYFETFGNNPTLGDGRDPMDSLDSALLCFPEILYFEGSRQVGGRSIDHNPPIWTPRNILNYHGVPI